MGVTTTPNSACFSSDLAIGMADLFILEFLELELVH
jgi:hypothetical protein